MIYLHLSGGLGNQLFQYAFGRALADRTAEGLVLDATWYRRRQRNAAFRSYELSHYPIRGNRAAGLAAMLCRLQMSRATRLFPALAPFAWLREPRIYRYSAPVKPAGDVYALGNWQSYRYFEHMRKVLSVELTPQTALSPASLAMAAVIRATNAVSLHVRRGDYVSIRATNNVHGACGARYYDRAISHVLERVAAPHFFVFSDDPAWVEANIQIPAPCTLVQHNGTDAAFQDLQLMTLCRHHVTANSSFSWWGAWLRSAYPDGIVVCPAQWLVGVSTTGLDIAPHDWSIV